MLLMGGDSLTHDAGPTVVLVPCTGHGAWSSPRYDLPMPCYLQYTYTYTTRTNHHRYWLVYLVGGVGSFSVLIRWVIPSWWLFWWLYYGGCIMLHVACVVSKSVRRIWNVEISELLMYKFENRLFVLAHNEIDKDRQKRWRTHVQYSTCSKIFSCGEIFRFRFASFLKHTCHHSTHLT